MLNFTVLYNLGLFWSFTRGTSRFTQLSGGFITQRGSPRVLTRWLLLGRALSLLSLRAAGRHLCKRKAVGGYKLQRDFTLLLVFLYYAGRVKGIHSKRIHSKEV